MNEEGGGQQNVNVGVKILLADDKQYRERESFGTTRDFDVLLRLSSLS